MYYTFDCDCCNAKDNTQRAICSCLCHSQHATPPAPAVQCYWTDSGLWSFWCQYCKVRHVHGPIQGHRIAHCHIKDSPYLERGYFLIAPCTEARAQMHK